jgi:hypothetical protein
MDLPAEAPTAGAWDFRKTEDEYHGGYDFKGKRVLEIGAASGSHSFWLEKQGAEVVPYDLSPEFEWDCMPTFEQDSEALDVRMRSGMAAINNGWWYAAKALGSNLTLRHGTIYDVPEELGNFDVVTYGSVLLHVQNPVGAVQHMANRTRTIIITDKMHPTIPLDAPHMEFRPQLGRENAWGGWSWWWHSPQVFINMLKVIGYTNFGVKISKHLHTPNKSEIDLYTLIAER